MIVVQKNDKVSLLVAAKRNLFIVGPKIRTGFVVGGFEKLTMNSFLVQFQDV